MRSIIVACVLLCFVLPAPPTPTPDQFATPAPPPPTLVLLAPSQVALGQELRVNAAIFGDGSFDIALGMGNPAGFSTHDDLICSRRVETGRPATCSWWITAEKVGAHTIMVHVADVPAVRAVVRVGWAVWLPMVRQG